MRDPERDKLVRRALIAFKAETEAAAKVAEMNAEWGKVGKA